MVKKKLKAKSQEKANCLVERKPPHAAKASEMTASATVKSSFPPNPW